MKQLLLLLFLGTSAALPAAQAQQAPATAQPMYGAASVTRGVGGWFLVLYDGTTPNPKGKKLEENGKDRRFEDRAAVLNFLYAQGWEVLPDSYGNGSSYLLKRRTP